MIERITELVRSDGKVCFRIVETDKYEYHIESEERET